MCFLSAPVHLVSGRLVIVFSLEFGPLSGLALESRKLALLRRQRYWWFDSNRWPQKVPYSARSRARVSTLLTSAPHLACIARACFRSASCCCACSHAVCASRRTGASRVATKTPSSSGTGNPLRRPKPTSAGTASIASCFAMAPT